MNEDSTCEWLLPAAGFGTLAGIVAGIAIGYAIGKSRERDRLKTAYEADGSAGVVDALFVPSAVEQLRRQGSRQFGVMRADIARMVAGQDYAPVTERMAQPPWMTVGEYAQNPDGSFRRVW